MRRRLDPRRQLEAGDKGDDIGAALHPILVDAGCRGQHRLPAERRGHVPGQIQDARAAIRWLRANAGELGIDPDRIGAWSWPAARPRRAPRHVERRGRAGRRRLGPLEPGAGRGGDLGPTDFLVVLAGWTNVEPERAASKLYGGSLSERRSLVRLASPVAHVGPDAHRS